MRRECEKNETSPAAANELIGEISVRLSSLERCLLAGTDIDFDPIMGLVEKLCNEARLLAEAQRQLERVGLGAMAHVEAGSLALGQQLVLTVTDAGAGLSPQARSHLFDAFWTTKPDGMGMGLNICRSIIESHLGRLWVENNADGIGCTFKIILPLNPL